MEMSNDFIDMLERENGGFKRDFFLIYRKEA